VESGLSGTYYVKPTAMALKRAWKLCKGSARDVAIIRRHTLALRFWPGSEIAKADIDWDWIEGLQAKRIAELRIDEIIAGNHNLRVIFFKANRMLAGDRLLRIWILTVFQKKGQGFSSGEITSFRAMHGLLVQREYEGDQNA
jgi:hypothetical protein